MSFIHNGTPITVKIPKDVSDDHHNEHALATRSSWSSITNETLSVTVHAIDVITSCEAEVELQDAILQRHPNAHDLIDEATQEKLEALTRRSEAAAASAFEYWMSLLRWVTASHEIGREIRVGSESGWSAYLRERETQHDVWVDAIRINVSIGQIVTREQWTRVETHAIAGDEPPMHAILFAEASHCIDVADYRRAVIDMSSSCEVYLRSAVINALPSGVTNEVTTLIEEANINQHISHFFPALLNESERAEYMNKVKRTLSKLFAKRNKIMHMADTEGVSAEACESYRQALHRLFRLR